MDHYRCDSSIGSSRQDVVKWQNIQLILKNQTQIIINTIKVFAHRVRTGKYGQESKIKVGKAQLAIYAIGVTLFLDGHAIRYNIKEPDGKLILPLRYLLQTYRNSDPAAK